MKTVGIILATFIVGFGLIVSIVMFNFYRVKDQPIVVNNTKAKNIYTVSGNKDSMKIVTSVKTFECEVVDLANQNFKYNQIVCEDGRKDGFLTSEIIGKVHTPVKVGDTVIATFNEDGILNVRLVTK